MTAKLADHTLPMETSRCRQPVPPHDLSLGNHRGRLRARTRPGSGGRAQIDNDPMCNSRRGRAGLKRAQLELSVIESQLRSRGLLE